ncbi:MAG TPA: isopentenyl-diphosphate Delta-isomerase [Chitinophagaceae bacterium]|nr:isopentenyl-diphosphate Delta-isomerase [Chitinophagaceae bacterium]
MIEVILVDKNDVQTGLMEKMEAHRKGLLHRAFSVFVFNKKGDFLLQQRSPSKYHSPGLWTNTCCSHPLPGEDVSQAANRRLSEEMGFTTNLSHAFSFVYRATFDNELTEHEYDHVFTGVYEGKIEPDKNEVKDYCYKSIRDIEAGLQINPGQYTEWFRLAFPQIKEVHDKYFNSK